MNWLKKMREKNKSANQSDSEVQTKRSGGKFAEKIVISIEAMPMLSFRHLVYHREVDALSNIDGSYFKPVWRDSEGFSIGALHNIAFVRDHDGPTAIQDLKTKLVEKHKELISEGWELEPAGLHPMQSSHPDAILIVTRGY